MTKQIQFVEHKAYNMRRWSIIAPATAGSGHTTTCLSAADIMSVLFFYAMQYDPKDYECPDNDRFILSKGHASPLLYAAWKEVGVLSDEDMLTYRRIDSVLEGHPTLRFPYTEAATGALGVGLSVGVGEALCAKLDQRDYYTYVLLGDGETSEGAVWEAVQIAAHYKLDNLIAIIDANRLGQTTQTMYGHTLKRYEEVFTAFGWKSFTVDGHNVKALMNVLDDARKVKNKPAVIIAKTIKGYGVDLVADKQGFHGKALKKEQVDPALADLKKKFPAATAFKADEYHWEPYIPKKCKTAVVAKCPLIRMPQPDYSRNEKIPTRKAFGQALSVLGSECSSVVSLDAEVKNSTFAEIFEASHPDRFFQCFIAEQNMIGMGIGFDRRGRIPFISTFSAFMSRAHDHIRMAAVGQAKLRLVGSHAGVSIGQDGPSQMGLEDIALMRCLPKSIVLYPCDAVSTYKLVEQMANYEDGISYLRTTRMATPVIYDNNEEFPIGGCKVLRKSDQDKVCVIGAGVTVFEALKAHAMLAKQNIQIAIIDLYSVKPLDIETIIKVAKVSDLNILTVEDHYPEGGIGEAVVSALRNTGISVESLAVKLLPRSGKPEELMALECIDADAIVKKVKKII